MVFLFNTATPIVAVAPPKAPQMAGHVFVLARLDPALPQAVRLLRLLSKSSGMSAGTWLAANIVNDWCQLLSENDTTAVEAIEQSRNRATASLERCPRPASPWNGEHSTEFEMKPLFNLELDLTTCPGIAVVAAKGMPWPETATARQYNRRDP